METNNIEFKVSPVPAKRKLLNFFEAMEQVAEGKSAHKLSWIDLEYYVMFANGRLSIHKPEHKFHDWIIVEADLIGEDWIIL